MTQELGQFHLEWMEIVVVDEDKEPSSYEDEEEIFLGVGKENALKQLCQKFWLSMGAARL